MITLFVFLNFLIFFFVLDSITFPDDKEKEVKKIPKPIGKQDNNKLVDDYKIKFPESLLKDNPGLKIDLNQFRLNKKQVDYIEHLGNNNEFYHFFINLYDFVLKEIIDITNTNLDDNDGVAIKERKEFLLKNDKFIRKIFNRIWLKYSENIKEKIFEFLFEKKKFNMKEEKEKEKEKKELVELIENFYKKMVFNKIYESFLSKNENELKKENKKDKWMKDWKEFLRKKETEKDFTYSEYKDKMPDPDIGRRHSYFYIEDIITTQTPSSEQQTKIPKIDEKEMETTTVPNFNLITSTIANNYKSINQNNDGHMEYKNIDLIPEKKEDIGNFVRELDQNVTDTAATLLNIDLTTPAFTNNYRNFNEDDSSKKEDIDLIENNIEDTGNLATESEIEKPEKEYPHKVKNIKGLDFITTSPDEQQLYFIDPYVNSHSTEQNIFINTLKDQDKGEDRAVNKDALNSEKEQQNGEVLVKDSFINNEEVSNLSQDILNNKKYIENKKMSPTYQQEQQESKMGFEKYPNKLENVKDKIAKKSEDIISIANDNFNENIRNTPSKDIITSDQDEDISDIDNVDNLKEVSYNYDLRGDIKEGIFSHKDILNSEDINNHDLKRIKGEIGNLKNQDLVKDTYTEEEDILENREEGLIENADKEDNNLANINELNNKDLEKIEGHP